MSEEKNLIGAENLEGVKEPQIIIVEKTVKGDYIKNPITGRKILVGSSVYNKLVKSNLLKIDVNDLGRVIYQADTAEEAKKAMPKVNVGNNLVKERKGNTVRSKARTMKIKEFSQKIKDITLKVYEINKQMFHEDMTSQQVQELIKKLVDEALVSDDIKYEPLKRDIKYVVEDVEEDDVFDEEEDEEDDE
jgi:hypothetical protein